MIDENDIIRKQRYQWLLQQMQELKNNLELLEDQHQMTRSQVEKNMLIDQHVAFENQFEQLQSLEQEVKERLVLEIIPMISKNL